MKHKKTKEREKERGKERGNRESVNCGTTPGVPDILIFRYIRSGEATEAKNK